MPPKLTDEQQKLVTPRTMSVARGVAWRTARSMVSRPDYDEVVSVGYEGLCVCAGSYDRDRNENFETYLTYKLPLLVIDWARLQMPLGTRRVRGGYTVPVPNFYELSLPWGSDDHGTKTIADTISSDDLPVGWEIESADEVRKLARDATPGREGLVEDLFLRADFVGSMRAAAVEHGVSESYVSYVLVRLAEAVTQKRVRRRGRAAKTYRSGT